MQNREILFFENGIMEIVHLDSVIALALLATLYEIRMRKTTYST